MNVLSLFDGISCGQLALKKSNITIDNYYASEINKNSIKVTQSNFPNTIQLGDICCLGDDKLKQLPKIDLLIGGSPCQGFSIAGKKLNFNDDRSKLFFEYVRILNWLKQNNNPNIKFLLENVKMKDEIADAIDDLLGVERVFIDSRHFTGHIRKRYYWSNIHIAEIPQNNLKIKDIINQETSFDKDMKFFLDRTMYNPSISFDGIITINPKDNNGKQTWQRGRVYDIEGNCPTICASLFDLNITKDHKKYRKLTIEECEKLQGIPVGYTKIVTKNQAGEMLGNGWTVDVISHILNGLNVRN